MEESQQSQRQKSGKLDFSVVLSFAVAIFAVFSIGTFAVVSNQGSSVSYAAPTNDSFSLILNDAYGSSKAAGIKGLVESSASFYVPLYYAGTEDFNHLVFCVEAALRSVENGSNYTKGNTITDPGLIYILSHSYANNQPIVNDHSNYKDYVEIFATQAAVWAYLNVDINQFKTDTTNTIMQEKTMKKFFDADKQNKDETQRIIHEEY